MSNHVRQCQWAYASVSMSVSADSSVDGWHVPTTKISVKPYICISVSVDIYVGV